MNLDPLTKSFPSWNPNKYMDYIFYTDYFKVKEVKVKDMRISDHLPVIADIEI